MTKNDDESSKKNLSENFSKIQPQFFRFRFGELVVVVVVPGGGPMRTVPRFMGDPGLFLLEEILAAGGGPNIEGLGPGPGPIRPGPGLGGPEGRFGDAPADTPEDC